MKNARTMPQRQMFSIHIYFFGSRNTQSKRTNERKIDGEQMTETASKWAIESRRTVEVRCTVRMCCLMVTKRFAFMFCCFFFGYRTLFQENVFLSRSSPHPILHALCVNIHIGCECAAYCAESTASEKEQVKEIPYISVLSQTNCVRLEYATRAQFRFFFVWRRRLI